MNKALTFFVPEVQNFDTARAFYTFMIKQLVYTYTIGF